MSQVLVEGSGSVAYRCEIGDRHPGWLELGEVKVGELGVRSNESLFIWGLGRKGSGVSKGRSRNITQA